MFDGPKNPVDVYQEAVKFANMNTINEFGEGSIPTESDTAQDDFWLSQFDAYMIISNM